MWVPYSGSSCYRRSRSFRPRHALNTSNRAGSDVQEDRQPASGSAVLGHTKLDSDVGRRFRCAMRINCGELDPSADITLVPDKWHPHMPDRLNEDELADCPC